MRSYWIRVGPNPTASALEEEKTEIQTDTQEKCHVKTKAETGMLELQVKECLGLQATTKS